MANSLLNLEILYDLVWENNNEILSVITSLNNRLEHLRAKRKKVESTIDQLIFSNENSDGFFYSFLDSYSTVDNVDLNISLNNQTQVISKVQDKIDAIYREVKKNEVKPDTDYLFNNVGKSNLDKTIEKLEKMQNMTFVPRS